ncbi:AI-2E family transporter [Natrarchaeobius chitinivorans]|uniref:AI-2E family transporter n=1 Tax=Natrarchaeobius chitinivorans TaxID=1679083 RepID=A0A3N6P093_NATCH|nr:AI-2E family transporter [Natrarchaeobius chitinivorans]RQG90789.1 AI-2E family transporter [Natrarchaeobius chitinivorans]
MADRTGARGWFSDRTGLTAIAVASGGLAALIVLPYLQYVLLGVVLAYILMPAQRRLEPYVGSMVAALTLVAVAILAILLPLAYVLAIALGEALEILTAIQEGTLGVEAVESRLETTGYAIDLVEMYETYQEPIETGLQGLATSGFEVVSGLPAVLIGLTVTLFVLFALLRDGDALVAWIRRVLPVDDEIQQELYADLDQLMWASVVGNVVVAAIQAVLLGIGLAVLGLPAVIFLTVATFVLALLPLVGAFGIWVPVTLYLLAVGRPLEAGALAIYGSLVSASDTYLRPALIGRTSAFNSAIVVVGIFGGIVVFGAVGLFIGPVILGGAKLTLDAFARERADGVGDRGESDADPLEATDTDTEGAAGAESTASDRADGDGADDVDPTGSDDGGSSEADDPAVETTGATGVASETARRDERPDLPSSDDGSDDQQADDRDDPSDDSRDGTG